VGLLPKANDLNTEGLHLADGALDTLLDFDAQGWQAEIAAIGEYLDGYGDHLPEKLRAEQQRVAEALKQRAQESVAPAKKAAVV
jgi:phosphoenolpyruvate carboxykinase (GTP)